MSKTFSLSVIVSTFLGDAEAGVNMLGDAIESAVLTLAAHGTDAPYIEACKMVAALKGTTTRVRAVRAGFDTIKSEVARIQPGKVEKGAAATLADSIGGAFVLAAGEVLNAPKITYAKAPASEQAAKALKTLAGLSAAQFSAMLRTNAGADLATRIATQGVINAADTVKPTADKVQAAKTLTTLTIGAAMQGEPATM